MSNPHSSATNGEPIQLPTYEPSSLLNNKIVVITGAGRGIGRAIACSVADASASVVVVGRTAERLEETVAIIRNRKGKAAAHVCDVSDVEAASTLIQDSKSHFGSPNVLINNAGIAFKETSDQAVTHKEFDALVATNFRGVYYTCIGAARQFLNGGNIINISSVTANTPDPELITYGATKAAVDSLTRAFAAAYGERLIRVNSIAPSYLDSPLNRSRKADSTRAAALIKRTPLGRWGLPADVANVACFLASDRSSFITGQTIAVDGGYPHPLHIETTFSQTDQR